LTAEAGCILGDVQRAAASAGKMFPLSLAAEDSCMIGGNLATNAGGTAVLRYGSARDLCLGLEVVTPGGELWDGLLGLRKNNAGYDLRDLFIGSEGTLGIITAAVLRLHPQPRGHAVGFLAVDTVDHACNLLDLARDQLDSRLTAFELLSEACLDMVLRHDPAGRRPLEHRSAWYLLVELSESDSYESAESALNHLLERAFEHGLIRDGVVAGSIAQAEALWSLRENISESQGREGPAIKHDISLPISRLAAFIDSTGAAIAEKWPRSQLVVFGHLGDGNLHYNLSPACAADHSHFLALEPAINRLVHDAVNAACGSISAEHGLGVLRRDESARYRSTVESTLMRAVKKAIDPDGIMNPGKVLSAELPR
jgi:FAD/FMN-containing dehydrogenase